MCGIHAHQNRALLSLTAAALAFAAHQAVTRGAYDNTLTNTYVGQSTAFYCGPATALMTLNATTVNGTQPTQANLYNAAQTIQAGLTQQGDYATSPDGLRGVLQANDPAHNYVAYNISNYDQAVRTLAYNVDHYQVPGGALINRGAHWIDVFGVDTSVQPSLTNGFTVNGFYVRDPWTGFAGAGNGLGRYRYLANTPNGFQRYFTPQGYGNWNFGKWNNNYAFVTDPDPDTDASNSGPVISGSTVSDAAAAVAKAIADDSGVPALDSALAFENGGFSTTGVEEVSLWNGGQDWLVPYYQTVGGAISGAFMIDAATGTLDQALYEDVAGGDTGSLSSLDALVAMEDSESAANIINDNQVPEPASLALVSIGMVALLRRRAHRVSR